MRGSSVGGGTKGIEGSLSRPPHLGLRSRAVGSIYRERDRETDCIIIDVNLM